LFAQWYERFIHWQSLGLSRGKVSWFIPPQLEADTADGAKKLAASHS
jgi:hypothetical protein